MNFKATILACITFLAGIAIIVIYSSQQDRYAIFSQDKAIFVFDRKNVTLNYCNEHSCQLITPYVGENGVMPTQIAIVNGQPVTQPMMMQQPGMMQMTQITGPFMSQMIPQSSLQVPAAPMNMQPFMPQMASQSSLQVSSVPMGMQPQQVILMPAPQVLKAPAAKAAARAPTTVAPAKKTAKDAPSTTQAEAPAKDAPATEAPAAAQAEAQAEEAPTEAPSEEATSTDDAPAAEEAPAE